MEPNNYNILLFKTNIQSSFGQEKLKGIMDTHQKIERWTIDTEDVDCVLRIVCSELEPKEVIEHVTQLGYECIELE